MDRARRAGEELGDVNDPLVLTLEIAEEPAQRRGITEEGLVLKDQPNRPRRPPSLGRASAPTTTPRLEREGAEPGEEATTRCHSHSDNRRTTSVNYDG